MGVPIKSIRRISGRHAWLIETIQGIGYRFHDELS